MKKYLAFLAIPAIALAVVLGLLVIDTHDAGASALSAARYTQAKNTGAIKRYLMKASTTIYSGGMVMINSSGTAEPAAASASNHGVVGVATETKTSASSGSYYITAQEGWYLFGGTTLGQEDVGNILYAEDDQTVDDAVGSNEPIAGILMEYVSATSGWVAINPLLQGRVNSISSPVTLTADLTLAEGATLGQAVANNKVTFTENSEDVSMVFASNAVSLESSTGVVSLDTGLLNLTCDQITVDGSVILENDAAISNAVDGAIKFAEASEDLICTFTANTATITSSTAVDTVDFGTITPKADGALIEGTITMANGGTVANGTNNKITIGENSEDMNFTFSANALGLDSSTGVTSLDFGAVLPKCTSTSDIGWAIVSGANTACNTTCTHACVFGFDEGAADAETIVGCTDATADKCLCAGAN